MTEPMLNAADEEQTKKRKDRAKDWLKQTQLDRKAVLSTPEGRRFAWDLLDRCGLYMGGLVPDPVRMAFNEGARNIGLSYLAEFTRETPDLYLLMQNEALKKTKEEEAYG